MSRWQAEENGRQNQRPTLHGCSSSTSSGDFPVIASPEESMFGTPRTGNGREYSGPVLYTPSENSREFPNPVQITSATQSRDHSRQSSRHFNGLYGFGNIANAKDRTKSVDADDMSQFRDYTMEDSEDLQTNEETRLLLSRKVPIPSAKLSPYRLIIVIRLVVMCLFFRYRILHPVRNAYVLWVISVVCEIWFAISWILDQFPKWQPITRETYLDRLSLRFENGSESRLDPVDVFVSTVDPLKEPPLVTANTVLSILSVDYPVEKVSCYVSDDGAAKLTFDAMAETAEFARKWVPCCKKYDIEPRAPEWYFSQKVNIFKDKVQTSFIKDRRAMKREYEEFKVRINGMVANAQDTLPEGWIMKDGTPWPGNNIRDHPAMIQVFLGHNGGLDTDGNELPRLLYISREKRPGFQHHKKAGAMNALVRVSAVLTNGRYMLNLDCDHYINNSKALREAMCFMMDEKVGKQTCYVQFPQRFDAIDVHDRYANRNTVFFDINMKGLDGIQGPVYVGTGCVFNRAAVYGFDAPKKQQKAHTPNCITTFFTGSKRKSENRYHGNYTYRDSSVPHYNLDDVEEISYAGDDELAPSQAVDQTELKNVFGESEAFLMSTFIPHGGLPEAPDTEQQLREAIQVISCGYEDKSSWGSEIGWIYGSVTEDILTGLKMHTRGWRSIYCMPARPAFKGTAPINLSDRLHQVLRWALGSVEILFSRHCPIWYGWSGRLKFLQRLAYINTSIYPLTSIPLLIYCVLPAICLLTNRFIIADIKTGDSVWFLSMFISIFATGILEMRWGGIGVDEWWRNEQFWVIGGVSAHLFAVVQGLVKIVVGIEPKFTVTAKSVDEDEGAGFAELYLFKWTALLIPPTTLIVLNCIGMAAGISSAISSGYSAWGSLIGRLLFSFWVVVHLYPFLKGLMGRHNRMPSFVVIWSVLLASIMSLLWVRIDPFTIRVRGPSLEQCGLAC